MLTQAESFMMIDERVQRGMRVLDAKMPGWERKINILTLDISNPRQCVCGQLDPQELFSMTTSYLGVNRCDALLMHGFTDHQLNYPALTACWRNHIVARLKKYNAQKQESERTIRDMEINGRVGMESLEEVSV